LGKKSKKAKKKPKKVLTTREILRRIEKEKRRKKIVGLCIFAVIAISIVTAAWYMTSRPTSTGALVIDVVDEHTDNPIGGATITISGPHEATVQADEQGVYRFESIPAGTYTITVSEEGYHVHPETASVEIGRTTYHTVKLHTHH
jgi:hypothetical protein